MSIIEELANALVCELDVLFESAVVAALLTAKDKAPFDELMFVLANVDVGERLVDAAAALAVEFEIDVTWKDSAIELLVAFENVVAVEATAAVEVKTFDDATWKDRACEAVVPFEMPAVVEIPAAVAIPDCPDTTAMVRISPDELLPVFTACAAVVVGLPVITETVKIDPS